MGVAEAFDRDGSSVGRGLNVGADRDPSCSRAAAVHDVDVVPCYPARERTAVDPHDRISPHSEHQQHRPRPADAETRAQRRLET